MAIRDIQVNSPTADLVAVFDQNLNQMFTAGLPLTVDVIENADLPEHPLETGTLITDHIIYHPTEVELPLMLTSEDYRSVYEQIRQVYRDAGGPLIVQTKASTYPDMYLQGMPHEERPSHFDAIRLTLRLKQARLVGETPTISPRNRIDVPLVDNGERAVQSSLTRTTTDVVGETPTPLNQVITDEVVLDKIVARPSTLVDVANGLVTGPLAQRFPAVRRISTGVPLSSAIANQSIPIDPVANQAMSVVLNNDRYDLTLRDLGGIIGATVVRNGTTLVSNAAVTSGEPIIPYGHLATQGANFLFNTANDEIPTPASLGSTQRLLYYITDEVVNGTAT